MEANENFQIRLLRKHRRRFWFNVTRAGLELIGFGCLICLFIYQGLPIFLSAMMALFIMFMLVSLFVRGLWKLCITIADALS